MLELKNVSKTFDPGSPTEVKVMEDFNLQIKEGEFITIIGGNGSGKSTLMNLISGSIAPDKGLVLLNEFNISKMSEDKRALYFGRVFQDPMMGTASDMTILENLTLAYGRGRMRSLFRWSTKAKDKEYFIQELKRLDLGLENRLHDKVGLLSGGQRQALTLLMATIRQQPSLYSIKRDYIRFYMGDKEKAKEEMLKDLALYKEELKEEIKNLGREEALKNYHQKLAKYDLTKQILLLDEHTAALDPKTAKKVLELTDMVVKENKLTTIMITHNMKDAIKYGNRLIMMSKGKIVIDISGEEKKKLTVEKLLKSFETTTQDDMLNDSQILSE